MFFLTLLGFTVTIENTLIFKGRIVEMVLERCVLPNGRAAELEVVRHPGGAAIVAIDAAKRVCLVYQYRHVCKGWLWELPAGKIDNNEASLVTAQRELAEEAGVLAKNWQSLGICYSSPGILTEVIYLYLATELKLQDQELGQDEILEVHWVALEDAMKQVISGQINDSKTIVGLLRAAAFLKQEWPIIVE